MSENGTRETEREVETERKRDRGRERERERRVERGETARVLKVRQSQLSLTVRTERRTAVSGGLVYVQEEKCIFRISKLARAEPQQGGKVGGRREAEATATLVRFKDPAPKN